MRAIILTLGYFIFSMYVGINQYMDLGELSTTFIIVTSVIFVLSIGLNLLLQNASPGSFGEELAIIGGGVTLFIIIQSAIFLVASPLFINFHSLSIWKIIFGLIILLFTVKIVFSFLTKRFKNSEIISNDKQSILYEKEDVVYLTINQFKAQIGTASVKVLKNEKTGKLFLSTDNGDCYKVQQDINPKLEMKMLIKDGNLSDACLVNHVSNFEHNGFSYDELGIVITE